MNIRSLRNLRFLLAAAGAASLIACRFFPIAENLPMVGDVWLGDPGSGGSGLSWAGDFRLYVGVALLAAAAVVSLVRESRLFPALGGMAFGWALAFAYNGYAWYREQTQLLSMMPSGDMPIRVDAAPASVFFGLFLLFTSLVLASAFVPVRSEFTKEK